MSRERNEALLIDHLAAETRHDMAATLATVHPDCTFVDTPLGFTFHGRNGARAHYEMWWTGFGATPDSGTLHWVSDDLVIWGCPALTDGVDGSSGYGRQSR